jgi:hypothetical protein
MAEGYYQLRIFSPPEDARTSVRASSLIVMNTIGQRRMIE